jgi:ketosteroid isomerase-like protein
MDGYEGPIGYELRDLTVSCAGNVAWSHSLNRVVGTLKNGRPVDMWFRDTTGFERVDGRWLVVHDHLSEPFDMQSFQAKLDLRP